MLIEEIFSLTSQLFKTVIQKAKKENVTKISKEYVERIADETVAIRNHVAKECIINRVLFDV
ncbi:MAG TPA: hypothetical protein VKM55_02900 [Candidatus Lokiarchaeia archaeon]|nr:hypothetical protein [Candidatus Lokiarchaeia archaeon]